MIYLLHGSDTTRSQKKLQEIIEEYRKKSGSSLNFHQFDAEEVGLEKVKEVLDGGSLFGAKKLLVIKYFFESLWDRKRAELLLSAYKDSPDTIIVLWDREAATQDLEAIKQYLKSVQEFKKEKKEEASQGEIFRLGDTFFTSPRAALKVLLRLLRKGEDDLRIFSYLANHARTLVTVKAHVDEKRPMPSNLGIHPFVVKKAHGILRVLPKETLYAALHRFFEEEHKIKTGATKARDSLTRMLFDRS